MIAIGAGVALLIGFLLCNHFNKMDRGKIEYLDKEEINALVLHARQDIKLVVMLLSIVIIMLGMIADKM
jgi:hypothetical protein